MRKLLYAVVLTLIVTACPLIASEIHFAVMAGDMQKVKALLAKNPELANSKAEDGSTPLVMAAYTGSIEMAKLLISYKAEVNPKGPATPLMAAVVMDKKEMVKYLMSKGADPKAEVEDGITAISMAQHMGKAEIAKILNGGKDLPVQKPALSYAPYSRVDTKGNSPLDISKCLKIERKAGAPGTKAVTYTQKTVNGCPVNVISVDLNDSRVKLNVAVTNGGMGSDESFSSFIKRTKPTAAINAAFFSKGSLLPIGDIVVDGQLVHYGGMGTGLCITDDYQVEFARSQWAHHTDWSAYKSVVCCGPRLLKDGKIVVDPKGEGFRDPHVLGRANRTVAGITPGNKLLLANTKKGVSLQQWAGIMKSLGCTDAINFDGGASMAMYYRGKTVSTPGRKLTNVLVVYE